MNINEVAFPPDSPLSPPPSPAARDAAGLPPVAEPDPDDDPSSLDLADALHPAASTEEAAAGGASSTRGAAGRSGAPAPSPNTDLIAGLGRRFRGPTLRMSFELRTSIARQIFRRDFVYVSQQLHALEASRRVQGLSRDHLNEALAHVGRRIDEVRALLRDSATQTCELIELHGHSGADVEFARPATFEVTIVSPHARDFMDVLAQADAALTQLERAWLLGLLEPAEKGRMAGDIRKAVQSVKETVRDQRQRIGAQVRELNARRDPAPPWPARTPPDSAAASAPDASPGMDQLAG